MIIWMIGAFFTWGLISDDNPGFWAYILVIPFWPFILGEILREILNKLPKTPPEKPETKKGG